MILYCPLITSEFSYGFYVSGRGKTGKGREKEGKDSQKLEVTSLVKQTRILGFFKLENLYKR